MTIGHNAVVHGATVEPDCLIGMGAIVLDGAVISAGSLVGAGAVVTPNTVIPPRSLVLGQPGRVVRTLSDEEVDRNRANAAHYVRMSAMYRGEVQPSANPFYEDRRR
ncbi:MAG: gamma carbonic anhydrase family protein [Bacteroidota bacterium]